MIPYGPLEINGVGTATTLIVALITAVGASVVTALASRPKTKGEAAQASANADVQLSTEARQWAQIFIDKAAASDARAMAAEERATAAEHRADAAERRAEGAIQRVAQLENEVRILQDVVARLGLAEAKREKAEET